MTDQIKNILDIRDIEVLFYTGGGVVRGVDGVSFNVKHGETVGVVGESGSGKSVTALSVMRLIPSPPGKIAKGEILFKDEPLLSKSEAYMRKIRGNEISMIFQEPMTSLNPSYTCGNQIIEVLKIHQKLNNKEAKEKAIEMLTLVGIPAPKKRVNEYPHELSGGMRQRVMIAIALACNPSLLIADEPTTALDVTIQAQILELMKKLKQEIDMSIIFISHDLGTIAEMADRVVVMYAGKVVEQAIVKDIFHDPQHPYTEGLLKSMPRLDVEAKRLPIIEGVVPDLNNLPKGCRFHPRCPYTMDICLNEEPEAIEIGETRLVSCWLRG